MVVELDRLAGCGIGGGGVGSFGGCGIGGGSFGRLWWWGCFVWPAVVLAVVELVRLAGF